MRNVKLRGTKVNIVMPSSVWLPFPPSVNNLFSQAAMRSKRTGCLVVRRFPSKAYKKWQWEAHILLRAARMPRFAEPVIVQIDLTPPDRRARDADNYCKPILDALVGARVLIDDSNRYVRSVVPVWGDANAKSGARVSIREIDNSKEKHRPTLTPAERKTLSRIRKLGVLTMRPGGTTKTLRGLTVKGYLRPLRGLFEFCPQGYAVID